jgi:NUDIX domain
MQIRHDKVLVYAVRKDESGVSHDFLQLHRAGGTAAASWQTIIGPIEAPEQAWQTALRLLKRDAGLIARELYRAEIIHSYYAPTDDAIFFCPQFLAVLDGYPTIVHGSDYDESRWVPRKYLETQFHLPSQRATLAEFCNEILDDGPARERLRIPLPTGGGNGKH